MLQENLGCDVVAFTRPVDALSALPTVSPAVIVTDYFMPGINGLEFIRLASALRPQAAFIMISGHNLELAEDELDRLPSLKGRLAKPFGWRMLADEIIRVWPSHTPAPWGRPGEIRSAEYGVRTS